MKRLLAVTGCILLTVFSAFIWDVPGAFFTGNFSALVFTLSRNAQLI